MGGGCVAESEVRRLPVDLRYCDRELEFDESLQASALTHLPDDVEVVVIKYHVMECHDFDNRTTSYDVEWVGAEAVTYRDGSVTYPARLEYSMISLFEPLAFSGCGRDFYGIGFVEGYWPAKMEGQYQYTDKMTMVLRGVFYPQSCDWKILQRGLRRPAAGSVAKATTIVRAIEQSDLTPAQRAMVCRQSIALIQLPEYFCQMRGDDEASCKELIAIYTEALQRAEREQAQPEATP